jgi:hypothetical protein
MDPFHGPQDRNIGIPKQESGGLKCAALKNPEAFCRRWQNGCFWHKKKTFGASCQKCYFYFFVPKHLTFVPRLFILEEKVGLVHEKEECH